MFEDYINQLKHNPIEVDTSKHTLNLTNSVVLNPDGILPKALQNIDNMSQQELSIVLQEGYKHILTKKFISMNKVLMANAFTNPKFLITLTQVLSNVKQFSIEEKINCNKMVYEYLALAREKDQSIVGLQYNIGLVINRDTIPNLLVLGLDQNTTTKLAIARYSTDKEDLAVKRVNVIIVNGDINVMTEQMIINIYQKLFDHLTPIVNGIMFDKWDDDLFEDNENAEEIYGLINLALLDILNEMPSNMIEHLLKQYAQTRDLIHSTEPVRFNIHSISSDYQRVINAIDRLESTGIRIPSL